MLKDQIAKLLARKLSGEASPDELAELQNILKGDPEAQYVSELLSIYWQNSNFFLDTSPAKDHFTTMLIQAKQIESENKIVPDMKIIAREKGKLMPVIKRFSMAAAIAGILAMSYWMLDHGNSKPKIIVGQNKKNEIIAGRGARSHLLLPDGSQVWLNSESKLIYSENFNDSVREVELEGEGYFDVVKDKKHPFIVHTSGIDIRVLGTVFNVKSYPQEATIEATLLRGMIEVINQNSPKASRIILRPHEKMIFDKHNNLLKKDDQPKKTNGDVTVQPSNISLTALPKNTPDTAIKETAWVYNKLMFEGDTFQELAIKMERWFNTRIYFKDQKVSNYRFRGVFRNENLEQALQALQLTASFTYKINSNDVLISKN